jgi:hypothetical protein
MGWALKLSGKGSTSSSGYQPPVPYNFRFTLQGTPAAKALSGMSLVTTLPEPIVVLLPMETPGQMVTFAPIHTFFPI